LSGSLFRLLRRRSRPRPSPRSRSRSRPGSPLGRLFLLETVAAAAPPKKLANGLWDCRRDPLLAARRSGVRWRRSASLRAILVCSCPAFHDTVCSARGLVGRRVAVSKGGYEGEKNISDKKGTEKSGCCGPTAARATQRVPDSSIYQTRRACGSEKPTLQGAPTTMEGPRAMHLCKPACTRQLAQVAAQEPQTQHNGSNCGQRAGKARICTSGRTNRQLPLQGSVRVWRGQHKGLSGYGQSSRGMCTFACL
jgi:hypothetical protein